jgi:Domain of unknown function (DUF4340)
MANERETAQKVFMTKSMWVAIFICAGLGLTYFALRKDRVRVGVRELILPIIDTNSIDKIEIDGIRRTEKVHLLKETSGWKVYLAGADKKKVSASSEYVSALLQAVPQIKSVHFTTEDFDKQSEFQVSDELASKIILYSGNKPVWSLLIGDEALGGGRYVRVPASLPIFVAKGNFVDLTRSVIEEWRNRIILPVTKENLAKVIIRKVGLKKAVVVDAVLLDPLAEILTNLRAVHFVESEAEKSLAQQELRSPLIEITVYDKNNSFYELAVASHQSKNHWVCLRGGNQIYEISPYVFEKLIKAVAAVYDANK